MKIALTILTIILTFNIGISQSDKCVDKANTKVEELNKLIISVNPDLALTDEQRIELQKLHIQKFKDVKVINESDDSKEDKKIKKKVIFKKTNKIIRKDILTKEQRKARKTAKDRQVETNKVR